MQHSKQFLVRAYKSEDQFSQASDRYILSLLLRTSTAAAELWQLVLTYCRARDLPLCNGFLVECAANQDWLAFVCHAQENRFPANKVCNFISAR